MTRTNQPQFLVLTGGSTVIELHLTILISDAGIAILPILRTKLVSTSRVRNHLIKVIRTKFLILIDNDRGAPGTIDKGHVGNYSELEYATEKAPVTHVVGKRKTHVEAPATLQCQLLEASPHLIEYTVPSLGKTLAWTEVSIANLATTTRTVENIFILSVTFVVEEDEW